MQSLGKIVLLVPAVGAKIWRLYVYVSVCWSRSEAGMMCVRGVRSSKKY